MKVVKFSKSYKNVLKLQTDYGKENLLNLKTILKINKNIQPKQEDFIAKIV